MFKWFAPAPHIERLPDAEIKRNYPRFRWQILESTFIGYATYYLVRNNIGVVAKDMKDALAYDDAMIGNILAATAISYGIGKFLMGALSDRSNPRVFMSVGLLLTALCNFAFGASTTYGTHLFLWALNGLFQGMGWSPCGRSMGHWFSEKERGLTFSIWNTSHNVGGGLAGLLAGYLVKHSQWQNAFFVPGVLALIGAVYLFWRLRDTPQSVGLPPVEEYRNDYTEHERIHGVNERELSFYDLFIKNVLSHRLIWILAIANFFAYVTRYAMIDWGPLYLQEVKGASKMDGGFAVFLLEWGGIPSTIFLGWLTDRMGGRRGRIAALAMIPIIAAYFVIFVTPPGYIAVDMAMLIAIGFFIYPVINLITIIALDVTSKKAIGTAAGFIGLFGYLGKTVFSSGFGAMLKHYKAVYDVPTAWNYVIAATLASTIIAFALLLLTWKVKPRA